MFKWKGKINMRYITLEFLERHSACKEGIDWFKRNFPNGKARITKTNLTKLINTRPRFWNGYLAFMLPFSDEEFSKMKYGSSKAEQIKAIWPILKKKIK
jgi:hypothetical protein